MYKFNRKYDILRHGHLYRRANFIDFPPDLCAYCGDSSVAWDHAPAISQVDNLDIKILTEAGGTFTLYPVCRQCNDFLQNSAEHTLLERLAILDKKYARKVNNYPEWSEEDLGELGSTLRSFILIEITKKDTIIRKAKAVSDNFYKRLTKDQKNENRTT